MKNFFEEYFGKSIKLIKSEKKLILIVAIAFIVFFALGVLFPELLKDAQSQIIKQLMERFEEKNILQIYFMILLQNATSTFITLLLGITLIIPMSVLTFNGFLAGAVTMQKAREIGLEAFLRLLPHGIFEIPAFLLAITFGIRIITGLFKGKRIAELYKEAFTVYIFVILPLLIVAALIETAAIAMIGTSLKLVA